MKPKKFNRRKKAAKHKRSANDKSRGNCKKTKKKESL